MRHRIDAEPGLSTVGAHIDIVEGLRYSPTVFRLLPREKKLFDLFEQQGANIVAADRALEALTLDDPNAKTHAQESRISSTPGTLSPTNWCVD